MAPEKQSEVSIKEFFDRLEESCFSLSELRADHPSAGLQAFREFRAQCEARELEGRDKFHGEWKTRDNCIEATEEGADLANYMMFDLSQARYWNEEEDWALALTAARYAYLAHAAALQLRSRRRIQISDGE